MLANETRNEWHLRQSLIEVFWKNERGLNWPKKSKKKWKFKLLFKSTPRSNHKQEWDVGTTFHCNFVIIISHLKVNHSFKSHFSFLRSACKLSLANSHLWWCLFWPKKNAWRYSLWCCCSAHIDNGCIT